LEWRNLLKSMQPFYFLLYFNGLENWHAPCKAPSIGHQPVGDRIDKGSFAMFQTVQARQFLVSCLGALVFAGLAITSAAPIFPIA